jgi:hypothetical protein
MVRSRQRTSRPLNMAECVRLLWNTCGSVLLWSLRKSALLMQPSSLLTRKAPHDHRRARLHSQPGSTMVCHSICCCVSSYSRRCYRLRSPEAPWRGDAIHSPPCHHRVRRDRQHQCGPSQGQIRHDLPHGHRNVRFGATCPCLELQQQRRPLQARHDVRSSACDRELWWFCRYIYLPQCSGAAVPQGTYRHSRSPGRGVVFVSSSLPMLEH